MSVFRKPEKNLMKKIDENEIKMKQNPFNLKTSWDIPFQHMSFQFWIGICLIELKCAEFDEMYLGLR